MITEIFKYLIRRTLKCLKEANLSRKFTFWKKK